MVAVLCVVYKLDGAWKFVCSQNSTVISLFPVICGNIIKNLLDSEWCLQVNLNISLVFEGLKWFQYYEI